MEWYLLAWVIFILGTVYIIREKRKERRTPEYKEWNHQRKIDNKKNWENAKTYIFGFIFLVGLTIILFQKEVQIFGQILIVLTLLYYIIRKFINPRF